MGMDTRPDGCPSRMANVAWLRLHARVAPGLYVLLAGLVGCAPSTYGARRMAARDLHCSVDLLEVRRIDAGGVERVRITGCGESSTYEWGCTHPPWPARSHCAWRWVSDRRTATETAP
jgi:hypothetical protein